MKKALILIYTLGPIIHNEEVVTDLAAKGVQVIEEKDLPSLTEGTVVIRSHGVGKAIYQELKENHLNYVDVTCPFVLKIHRIVEKQSHAGKHVVILAILIILKSKESAAGVRVLTLFWKGRKDY